MRSLYSKYRKISPSRVLTAAGANRCVAFIDRQYDDPNYRRTSPLRRDEQIDAVPHGQRGSRTQIALYYDS